MIGSLIKSKTAQAIGLTAALALWVLLSWGTQIANTPHTQRVISSGPEFKKAVHDEITRKINLARGIAPGAADADSNGVQNN